MHISSGTRNIEGSGFKPKDPLICTPLTIKWCNDYEKNIQKLYGYAIKTTSCTYYNNTYAISHRLRFGNKVRFQFLYVYYV